ncbi:MAG: SDR family oxidoreductase [Cytophagaceae bacterium]|nr:SDR family oxidoreductase [Cytophagaceae bacterium]MDW8456488.1 SDR family oxidoreductase [Cytophagaceae bacterium]
MKTAVITGGTKGIGYALVNIFAAHGFHVITCSRNKEDLDVLDRTIRTSHPKATLYTMPADLSKKEDIIRFIAFIKNNCAGVDVLINNTGVYTPGQIHNEPDGVLEKMIETNVYSAYHLTRGLIGDMIQRKSGHIFNICSTASITPYVNGGSYCISKYALYGMTKVLREEMKPHNIRVTAVLPGATYTKSWEGTTLPEHRFMKADDVALAIWHTYHLPEGTVVEEILMRPQLGDIS